MYMPSTPTNDLALREDILVNQLPFTPQPISFRTVYRTTPERHHPPFPALPSLDSARDNSRRGLMCKPTPLYDPSFCSRFRLHKGETETIQVAVVTCDHGALPSPIDSIPPSGIAWLSRGQHSTSNKKKNDPKLGLQLTHKKKRKQATAAVVTCAVPAPPTPARYTKRRHHNRRIGRRSKDGTDIAHHQTRRGYKRLQHNDWWRSAFLRTSLGSFSKGVGLSTIWSVCTIRRSSSPHEARDMASFPHDTVIPLSKAFLCVSCWGFRSLRKNCACMQHEILEEEFNYSFHT